MRTALQLDLTFEQVLSIVRQLSKKEKMELAKELEKEVLDKKLTRLLKTFKTDELDLKIIDQETEKVREELYGK